MRDKIASTTELQTELRRLMAYCASAAPSRAELAQDLQRLSERLAGEHQASERQAALNETELAITIDRLDDQVSTLERLTQKLRAERDALNKVALIDDKGIAIALRKLRSITDSLQMAYEDMQPILAGLGDD